MPNTTSTSKPLPQNAITLTIPATVCGIGINDVKHLNLDKTKHHDIALKRWSKMLGRVTTDPAYAGVEVHPEWLLYSNFAKWFDTAVDFYGSTDFELDKDLIPLTKGLGSNADRASIKRVYGPDTCLPIHHSLNVALNKCGHDADNSFRGVREQVHKDGKTASYRAKYGTLALGVFTTPHEAAHVALRYRAREFLAVHHLELKKLYKADLIGLENDSLIDVKRRLIAAALTIPDYSIVEDKEAVPMVTERRRGKPAKVYHNRRHWVVRIDHCTGNQVRVKSCASAKEAIKALDTLVNAGK
ncbi:hypothetical protein ACB040_20085 [Aeromonas sp. S11(2024)]|uniref:hypothetical protein n=1 Tax=unclassified Aeromonas TaxID=257493 RepID=UPI0035299954